MSYEILVPHRTRADTLAEVGDSIREGIQDPEQREIARNVVLDAAAHGDRTAGDLLDRLEDPGERLSALDRAREAIGLPDIETARVRARLKASNRALRPGRDSGGRILQQCPECGRTSTGSTGLLEPVADRKWWCAEHRHLAAPDDHLPPAERYVIGPNFELRAVGEEAERFRREDAKRREEQEEKNRRREAEAEAIEAARERWLEQDDTDIMGHRPSQVRINP